MRKLLLTLAIAAAGCTESASHKTADMAVRDLGVADLSGAVEDLAMTAHDLAANAPFGLDTRPANPTCVVPARPVSSGSIQIALEPAFPHLTMGSPMKLRRNRLSNDIAEPMRWFVAGRGGNISTWVRTDVSDNGANGTEKPVTVLTVSGIDQSGEGGLLGFAFDPDFPASHKIYVAYTGNSTISPCVKRPSDWSCSYLSRFTVTHNADGSFTQSAEEVIYQLAQPFTNHNGGEVEFGPDGYLYFSFGDGGNADDNPQCMGQNTKATLGKILRIDPRSVASGYAIPADNPFASASTNCINFNTGTQRTEECPEIYAYGLRNPFRFSFDAAPPGGIGPGIWVGDVGQNTIEEIDFVQKGKNYGWSQREGLNTFSNGCAAAADTNYIPPLVQFSHASGGVCVIGGMVYRGTAIPALQGYYVYGDYGTGRIFAAPDPYNITTTIQNQKPILTSTNQSLVGFAEDENLELYAIFFSGTQGAAIQKIVPSAPAMVESNFPTMLSQTGCVDPNDPKKPAAGMIPYDVNAPFWSDGASKQRWMALPDGQKIHINSDGKWVLPIGAVLMKEFSLAGIRLETRFMMRHADGDWAGYTYVWNDAQTEATLISDRQDKVVASQRWTFPGRSDCLQCHTTAAGRSLGLETRQLNGIVDYGNGRRANQLATLDHIGLFDAALPSPPPSLPAFVSPADPTAPLETRARTYLHTNCSHCHRPSSTAANVSANFLYDTPAAMLGVCNVDPSQGNLGVSGAKLLAPGNPALSTMSLRMHATDTFRMPKLGSSRVDPGGTTLIDAWITAKTTCP